MMVVWKGFSGEERGRDQRKEAYDQPQVWTARGSKRACVRGLDFFVLSFLAVRN